MIYWLACYPKTGSTWLREILNTLLSPRETAITSIPTFQKAFPSNPMVHKIASQDACIIKTHLVPGNKRMDWDKEHYPESAIILTKRHPLDVLLSSINYARIKEKEAYFLNNTPKTVERIIEDREIRYYMERFIECDGEQFFLSGSGHFSAYNLTWKRYSDLNNIRLLEICYEDFCISPKLTLLSLLDFIKIDKSYLQLETVLAAVENKTKLNGDFFWKKRAFNYQFMLPLHEIEYFFQHYQDKLNIMGYAQT